MSSMQQLVEGAFWMIIHIYFRLCVKKYLSLTFSQYMVILFLLFLVQFSVACACLAVNSEQQEILAQQVMVKSNYFF